LAKLPRWTADEAERALFRAGFTLVRSKGSHRIYERSGVRVVVPYHAGKTLHPKVIRQVVDAIGEDA
jgi:predicted RNA binding protein YcfA (HicA-like mRNA interferase family)